MKILYIGNDLTLQKMLTNTLRDFHTVRAPDENTSRLFLKHGLNYSLIVADETLPDGSGLSLALYARSLTRYAYTPVIILSGEARDVNERVRFVRPDDYRLLSKTVREELTKSVAA